MLVSVNADVGMFLSNEIHTGSVPVSSCNVLKPLDALLFALLSCQKFLV
jgi:hypothetical protein